MKTFSSLSHLINCTCEYILNELNASGCWYSLCYLCPGVWAHVSAIWWPLSLSCIRRHWTGSAQEPGHRVTGELSTCAHMRALITHRAREERMGDAGTLIMASFIKLPSWHEIGKCLQQFKIKNWHWLGAIWYTRTSGAAGALSLVPCYAWRWYNMVLSSELLCLNPKCCSHSHYVSPRAQS